MRTAVSLAAVALAITVTPVAAQHATIDAPGAYKTQFENDWVRVVRVHYGPKARIPVHAHPDGVTTYVYLNDSGPVRFEHSGPGHRVATRRPTEAGSFRIAGGAGESHEVVNTSDIPSDFVRVELKTEGAGRAPFFRGRRGSYPAGQNATDVQFTSGQMRITRLVVAPGQSVEVATPDGQPALLVALTGARLTVTRGSSMELTVAVGGEHWIEPRQREHLGNTGREAVEFLRFDLLTPPAR
ncbi:MAG: hypothetical protein AB7H88_17840 [Vicinamibacterales bacterium]